MYFIDYWRTQWILKRKWLLNNFFSNQDRGFSRFVILCDPRTGSTWLHTLLNSHPSIQSYGEVLSERDLSTGLHATIWSSHHPSIKSIGCKIFYAQLHEPRFQHILKEITSDNSIKIIDLSRERAWETLASLKLANRTNVWSTNKAARHKHQKMEVSKEELQTYQDLIHQNRKMVLSQLRTHQRLSLSYESMLADTNTQLKQVQALLGVRSRKLFSLLKKQSTFSLKRPW